VHHVLHTKIPHRLRLVFQADPQKSTSCIAILSHSAIKVQKLTDKGISKMSSKSSETGEVSSGWEQTIIERKSDRMR
jgi:hypothetical protein